MKDKRENIMMKKKRREDGRKGEKRCGREEKESL